MYPFLKRYFDWDPNWVSPIFIFCQLVQTGRSVTYVPNREREYRKPNKLMASPSGPLTLIVFGRVDTGHVRHAWTVATQRSGNAV